MEGVILSNGSYFGPTQSISEEQESNSGQLTSRPRLEQLRKNVLNSPAKIIIVRMARQSGKTNLLYSWIKQAALENSMEKILHFSRSSFSSWTANRRLSQELNTEIEYIDSPHGIFLKNGSSILTTTYSMNGYETIRGIEAKRAAIDDAGYIHFDQDLYSSLTKSEKKVLMACDKVGEGSLADKILNSSNLDFEYFEYNQRDALKDGFPDVRDLLEEYMSEEAIYDEYGPWERKENDDFKYLLKKD